MVFISSLFEKRVIYIRHLIIFKGRVQNVSQPTVSHKTGQSLFHPLAVANSIISETTAFSKFFGTPNVRHKAQSGLSAISSTFGKAPLLPYVRTSP